MGESMAQDAIAMGLDLTIAPDGRLWEESSYNRPAINREIWGENGYRYDPSKLDLYSDYNNECDFDEWLQDCDIDVDIDVDIVKASGKNYYFFGNMKDALYFSSKYHPSIFFILDKDLGFCVYTESKEISDNIPEDDAVYELLELAKRVKDTVKNTLELLTQEYSISEIAKTRDLTVSTIITHIEELNTDYGIRFSHIKPDDQTIEKVKDAYRIIISRNNPFDFSPHGGLKLKPIFDISGVDYEQIRLSTIFM